MPRMTMLVLLLCFHSALAKTTMLNMTIGANLVSPTCSLTVPAVFNFGNINRNDFLNGDAALRTKSITVTASCNNVSRVDIMLIPQHGTVSGRNNVASTSNSSVIYSVSLVDLGVNDVNFNSNTLWSSPGSTLLRMTLASNGTLTPGTFNTSLTIQLTYI